jgi:tetratricopeptide (TPR) repeat protein
MGSSTPPARTSSLPPDAPADERRKDALRGLARTLRDATVTTGGDRVATNVKRAQEAEASGDLVGASNFYRLAMAGAPERKDLQQAHERVSSALSGQLADSYEKQAHYEERSGRWPEASRAWVKVCEGRPNDVRALKSAAACLLRANGDLHTALRYAKMHVELAGENAGNLTLLARVYLGAGLKLNARRELEKAAKLDPSDEMIKNLLKEAR